MVHLDSVYCPCGPCGNVFVEENAFGAKINEKRADKAAA